MRIAFIASYNPEKIKSYSETDYYMTQALMAAGASVEFIGNLEEHFLAFYKLKRELYSAIYSENYDIEREPEISKSYARQIHKRLEDINSKVDVIFSSNPTNVAYLISDKPIVFWTESIFAGIINIDPQYENLSFESIKKGNSIEQTALTNCRLAMYSSRWGAKTALINYNLNPDKIKTVNYGASIERSLTYKTIKEIIDLRKMKVCKLLFAGSDWDRDGGNLSLEIARKLNSAGLKTELHIIGEFSQLKKSPDFVIKHVNLPSASAMEQGRLECLLMESHFLMNLSEIDFTGRICAKASAFGLPSLAFAVGGLPSVITDELNGKLFPIGAGTDEIRDYILEKFSSDTAYKALCLSSYNEYEARLNWKTAAKEVIEHLEKITQSAPLI
jgi:glycosyltransferase involved in cell wall biosynthesis